MKYVFQIYQASNYNPASLSPEEYKTVAARYSAVNNPRPIPTERELCSNINESHDGDLMESEQQQTTTLKRAEIVARARIAFYWIATLIVAWEMAAGGIWDLLRIEYVRVIMAHLGYPTYLLIIIGLCKIPCAFTLLLPRFGRLKEWAYAGAFFTYYGAAASHLAAGDGMHRAGMPIAFGAITLISWALRAPHRRLPSSLPAKAESWRSTWLIPILVGLGLIVLAFATLPKGPPPA